MRFQTCGGPLAAVNRELATREGSRDERRDAHGGGVHDRLCSRVRRTTNPDNCTEDGMSAATTHTHVGGGS